MATTLQYGRERAHLGRSLLNFMRITRDAHAPELALGEIGDLLFTAIEVFVGHAFGRPMVIARSPRACSAPIESGGFSWGQRWESLSALIGFWEAGRCRRPILGRCGNE